MILFYIICSVILFLICNSVHNYIILFIYLLFVLYQYKIYQLILIKIKDLIALFKDIKNKTFFSRKYGIYGFVGEYGQGKTICLAKEHSKLLKRKLFYNPDAYIFISNFGLYGTEHFKDLSDVMRYYRAAVSADKGLIVYWDEIQNEYPENDRTFPAQFRVLLTQNRKNKGVRLMWSTQDYTRVNKNIRLMSTRISHLRCLFKRYMIEKIYTRAAYEDYYATTDLSRKVHKRPVRTVLFIQTDKIRSMFDSFKMLDIAKDRLGL